MKERNSILPFPGKECFSIHLELENYLLRAKDGAVFSYEDLPETITSSAIENYGNWLSELTQEDPKHWERGAIIHYNNKKRNFVFPSNPQIGKYEVFLLFSKNHSFNAPVAAIHSHPDNNCFSFIFGDLTFFLAKANWQNQYPGAPINLVATTEDNFLLIKTKETPELDPSQESWQWEISRGCDRDPDIKEIKDFHSFGNHHDSIGLPEEEIKRLRWIAGVDFIHPFPGDKFFRYYQLLFQNYFAAKIYKYGFYYSKKDGLYKRFSKEELKEYLTEVIRERFLRAKARGF